MIELFKYLLVGVLNTLIGFGTIFLLIFVGVLPELANFLGYVIGIICSYFLNKTFTFKSQKSGDFLPFVLSMIIAYVLNFIAFVILFRLLGVNVYVSQIIAGGIYTLSGFLLSKFFVWHTS